MPSDAVPAADRAVRALEALAGPKEAFRSAVADAVDTVTALLDRRSSAPEARATRAAAELGAFASGRIDAQAFAGLLATDEALDPAAAAALEAARETLREVAARGDAAFRIEVGSGADLRDAVEEAFAELGRVFVAGRAIEAVVERRPVPPAAGPGRTDVEGRSGVLPFRAWTAAERGLAPPLVVEVDGTDVAAGGLAEFLDGAVKIVLVIRGASPPAPLARLVSPSVAVVQASDPDGLGLLARTGGPAVAALVDEGAARFLHDPAAGPTAAERLAVEFAPEPKPRPRLGGASSFQQAEELRLLATLASPPAGELLEAGEPEAASPAPPALPADRLAAWLLSRADLSGIETGSGAAR